MYVFEENKLGLAFDEKVRRFAFLDKKKTEGIRVIFKYLTYKVNLYLTRG